MIGLPPGFVRDAGELVLTYESVPPDQIVEGAPTTGYAELDTVGDVELGVWEMTPGAMRDVEVDEVFIVITGAGSVSFVDPPLPSLELRPGSVVRLTAGMQTVWTVRETLRKVYIAG